MEKIWLKSYPPGIPAEIDANLFRSLSEIVAASCTRFAEHAAYTQMGRDLSYRELDESTRRFGAWLQQRAGLKKGERIALMLPNLLQYPIAMFGALRAGLVIVNTNPLYTATELEHQLVDSGAKAIVVLENFAHIVSQVIARTSVRTVIVTSVGELLGAPKSWIVNYVVRQRRKQVPAWHIDGAVTVTSVLREGARLRWAPIELGHDDLAFLQYTGGTTGIAKGAMLSHGNLVANILQARAWIGATFPDEPATMISPLPLYHIFSLTVSCLFLLLGWHNILITNPRDFPAFVAELKRRPFKFMSGVNTLFNALMHTPGFESIDFKSLEVALGGGMAVQGSVARRWKELTGVPITQAWGMTETSPAACINIPGEDFNGSIGLPISSTEIAIKDDDGRDLPLEAVGEICVRGPQVMRGYWNRPDETAKVMLPEGWLRTGDIGRMDERGYVYIEDRKKDMINVSGFKLFPNEIEAVMAAHPGVMEVAAVAQPDEHSGEVVALFVVRKDPALTAADLIEYCRKFLTGYKIPKHIYFKAELPKSNVGKILRRTLRDELKA